MRIDPKALYYTDNGTILCGSHLGACAKSTGRDISGQPIQRVPPADQVQWRIKLGSEMQCEICEVRS